MTDNEADVTYSDDEFGSGAEDGGGPEEFESGEAAETAPLNGDDVDVESVSVAGHAPHTGNNEEVDDTEQYAGEFDEDAGEFDEDIEPTAGAASSLAVETAISTTATGVLVLQGEDLVGESFSPSRSLQAPAGSDSASVPVAVMVTDMDSEAAATPFNGNVSNASGVDGSATKRRSSVPAPTMVALMEHSTVKYHRSGSMPTAVLTGLMDKWMDTVPQDMSPERPDRSKLSGERLPVLEELQSSYAVDGETETEEADDGVSAVNNHPTLLRGGSLRVRSASCQSPPHKKIAAPLRRAQSLVYTSPLSSVEEVHAAEEFADGADDQEDPDAYSEDDNDDHDDDAGSSRGDDVGGYTTTSGPGSGDEALPGVEKHEGDTPFDAHDERAKAEIVGQAINESRVAVDDVSGAASDKDCSDDVDAGANPPSASEYDEQKFDEPIPAEENDDYADDDLESEASGELDALVANPDGGLNKVANNNASDFDVEEFIEDGRRETAVLLKEAQSLLQIHQEQSEVPSLSVNENEESSDNTVGGAVNNPSCDDDEDFPDYNSRSPSEEELARKASNGPDDAEQYDHFGSDFDSEDPTATEEAGEVPQNGQSDVEQIISTEEVLVNSVAPQLLEELDLQSDQDISSSSTSEKKMADGEGSAMTSNEDLAASTQPSGTATLPAAPAASSNPPKSTDSSFTSKTVRSRQKAARESKERLQMTRPEQTKTPSRPSHRIRPLTNSSPGNTASLLQPSRPATDRTTLLQSSNITQPRVVPRSSPIEQSTAIVPERQTSPRKTGSPEQKSTSPRSPSTAYTGPYRYLPDEYPQLPRKDPVPKQKATHKPSTNGSNETKRRLLQPVRTPANLRFDLPKMDKTKRDWLFLNMFRHGDDINKYESFIAPAVFAGPPIASDAKRRPLSARQVYGGNVQAPGHGTTGRRLVQQPDAGLRDRERNWVATKPHDSHIPAYDSILDKYCTTVTSPVIQRQIYQTRHRDLSPQLAFVLEKRVEKHCKQGYNDAFGGVSSSYKTDVVPLGASPPRDGDAPRSPRSQAASGTLK